MNAETAQATMLGTLEVVPIDGPVGAEIKGVNLANVDDVTYRRIRQALIDNLVLLFRDQEISDAEMVASAASSASSIWRPRKRTVCRRWTDCRRSW